MNEPPNPILSLIYCGALPCVFMPPFIGYFSHDWGLAALGVFFMAISGVIGGAGLWGLWENWKDFKRSSQR